ncbi:MAG TPA: hypothetical protein VFB00_04290, partial [Terriglobales bacterium]|nr:hypothetical protein [Terriglobales bacterium]
MTASVRKAWKKLSRMSGDEFRTRFAQEIGKRSEYALYLLGLIRLRDWNTGTGRAFGKFFFLPSEVPARVQLLRKHLPGAVADTLAEADEILRHRFRLLGYRDLDYGSGIDWHLDAVHGKRAPFKPWYKIRFLDFEHVGDHKIIWELNRHQHLVTLAKA